ncbi:MAG: SpoIIE family protein phosphatase [Myxococcota bacterium]
MGRGRNAKRRRRRRADGAEARRKQRATIRPKARPKDAAAGLPPALESMEGLPSPALGLVAGDVETKAIFSFNTPLFSASLHTSKGVGYKDVNEDGGALFRDEAGRVYLGVFDQAGGMGVGGDRGAASAIAARAFFAHARDLAKDPAADAAEALRGAALSAHHEIRRRGFDEATTFMAGRVAAGEAILLCVGDSGAMLFRNDGEHVHTTEKHRLPPPFPQNILTDALGQSSGEPQADEYRWRLRPGDFLVMGSDGLLDSALSVQEIGRVVFSAPNTGSATEALRAIVYEQMTDRRAKSDNVTIIVVRYQGGA